MILYYNSTGHTPIKTISFHLTRENSVFTICSEIEHEMTFECSFKTALKFLRESIEEIEEKQKRKTSDLIPPDTC